MPIYGYQCVKCNNKFEIMQSVNENTPPACPECGAETKRVYFPVGIVFKGSGFHINDYPSSKRRSSEPSGGTSTSATETPSGNVVTSTESTPAKVD